MMLLERRDGGPREPARQMEIGGGGAEEAHQRKGANAAEGLVTGMGVLALEAEENPHADRRGEAQEQMEIQFEPGHPAILTK